MVIFFSCSLLVKNLLFYYSRFFTDVQIRQNTCDVQPHTQTHAFKMAYGNLLCLRSDWILERTTMMAGGRGWRAHTATPGFAVAVAAAACCCPTAALPLMLLSVCLSVWCPRTPFILRSLCCLHYITFPMRVVVVVVVAARFVFARSRGHTRANLFCQHSYRKIP